jgi:hypothetical protein
MLRMSDADLARARQEILIAQLKAGYDSFTWSRPDIPPVLAEIAHDAPPSWTAGNVEQDVLPVTVIAGGLGMQAWRMNRQLTQADMGQMFNVTTKTISDWERGKSKIPPVIQEHLRMLMQTDEGTE